MLSSPYNILPFPPAQACLNGLWKSDLVLRIKKGPALCETPPTYSQCNVDGCTKLLAFAHKPTMTDKEIKAKREAAKQKKSEKAALQVQRTRRLWRGSDRQLKQLPRNPWTAMIRPEGTSRISRRLIRNVAVDGPPGQRTRRPWSKSDRRQMHPSRNLSAASKETNLS